MAEDAEGRRLQHVVLEMHEIDESWRESSPPRVKRTRRVFPRLTYEAHLRAMRCSGVVNSYKYVVERSPLLIISREFCPKTMCNIWVIDLILPAWSATKH